MTTHPVIAQARHPVDIDVQRMAQDRNRLTCAFRPILAIPHLLLVGGPVALAATIHWRSEPGNSIDWGTGTGVLGAVAGVCAVIAWFAIVFGGTYPPGLRTLATFYLRWRVRAIAYLMLLRDEYPPFGDEPYPAGLTISPSDESRDRMSVAFRIFLALPHILIVWCLGIGWMLTTLVAWVLRWSTRVEAYLLLLHDRYPPFALE
jgi:hypothetical protein